MTKRKKMTKNAIFLKIQRSINMKLSKKKLSSWGYNDYQLEKKPPGFNNKRLHGDVGDQSRRIQPSPHGDGGHMSKCHP